MNLYTPQALLKFGDEKHLKQLQEGKVYLNTMQFFREYEEKESDTVIGDKSEGFFEFYAKSLQFRIPEDKSVITKIPNCTISFAINKIPYNMVCFYTIYEGNLDKKISEEDKEKLEIFGDHVLIIDQPNLFFHKLDQELINRGYGGERAPVQYCMDGKNVKQDIESFQANPETALFRKSERYSYQREYRYVLEGKSNAPVIVDIGNISDFTTLFPTSEVFKPIREF